MCVDVVLEIPQGLAKYVESLENVAGSNFNVQAASDTSTHPLLDTTPPNIDVFIMGKFVAPTVKLCHVVLLDPCIQGLVGVMHLG